MTDSLRSGCNNLYLHSKIFDMSKKSNLYLTPFNSCSPVNPSTPTFTNINLTKPIKSFLDARKITQKWLNIICFHPETFIISSKSNLYMTSISSCGPVISSTSILPNINPTKTTTNLFVA